MNLKSVQDLAKQGKLKRVDGFVAAHDARAIPEDTVDIAGRYRGQAA